MVRVHILKIIVNYDFVMISNARPLIKWLLDLFTFSLNGVYLPSLKKLD
jgi:hypothetical protein